MTGRSGLFRAVMAAGIISAIWIGLNADKPVHTDDPFFLYWARTISPVSGDQPMKYFNWLRYEEPMAAETQHTPPGWALVLAGARHAVGERVRVLHWLEWPFAVMFLVGVFLLARVLGAPAWASMLVCGTSPVFVMPTASLLGDIPALGLGLLGLSIWTASPALAWRIVGALLLGLAGQMKMSILVLYPLLAIKPGGGFGLSRRDWILAALSLLLAGSYPDVPPHNPDKAFIAGNLAWIFQTTWNPGLLFMKLSYLASACGALMLPAVSFGLPVIFRSDLRKVSERVRVMVLALCAIPLLSLAGFWKGQSGYSHFSQIDSGVVVRLDTVPPTLNTLWFYLVIALFLAWGRNALFSARTRQTDWLKIWLLSAVAGFLGATWFPAMRHILPVLPALVMLYLIDLRRFCGTRIYRIGIILALAGNLLLGLSLSRNDALFARFCMDAADRGGKEAKFRNLPLVTTASWGLRYYTERQGGRILESSTELLPRGAVMLIPTLTDRRVLPAGLRRRSRVIWKMSCPPPQKWPLLLPVQPIPPVITLSAWHGGYVWFPFAFTRAPTESVTALEIRPVRGNRK